MSKKFVLEKSGINNALPRKDKTGIEKKEFTDEYRENQFKRRYYDLDTNQPLPLSQIEIRLKKNFERMDRISAEVMLDLYFIYCNWDSFYNRRDSFKDYLKNAMPFSRSYCYDIIRIVKMLIAYKNEMITKESYGTTLFIEEIIELLQSNDIRKLKFISQVKDKTKQYKVLDKILDGNEISETEIFSLNKQNRQKPSSKKIIKHKVKLDGMDVFVDDVNILTFKDIDEMRMNDIFKIVSDYYNRN